MSLYTRDEIRQRANKLEKSASRQTILNEAAKFSIEKEYQIFLSHSYLDANEILVIKEDIQSMGYSVYVDWIEDSQLNREDVTKETANILRERMKNSLSLLYATSANAESSLWMPWELGYFDGLKDKVAILPILESSKNTNQYSGQEYLGLYPYVTKDRTKSGGDKLWVHHNENTYVLLEAWLNGHAPTCRG